MGSLCRRSLKRGTVFGLGGFACIVLAYGWCLPAVGDDAAGDSAASRVPPNLIETRPAIGASGVDPASTELVLVFDQDMGRGFSWTGGGDVYPEVTAKPYWRTPRECVLPVKLSEGRYYRVGINSKSHRNFQSAAGIPVRPQALYFCTKGASEEDLAKVRKPEVVELSPANGSEDVPATTTELTVAFSCPMGGGFSWTGGGESYPEVAARPKWNEDQTVCTLPVNLKPGREYRLGLNSPSHNNFQSAYGVPLDPAVWTFSTAE